MIILTAPPRSVPHGAHVNYQVINPDTFELQTATTKANSLLTADGIRHIYTSLVPNFMGFTAVGLMIVAMIGAGVAEESGLVNALIRKLVIVSPAWALTYILALRRHSVEHRLRRGLSGSHPSGGRRLPEHRSTSPCRPGAGLCRGRRRIHRQHADQAARRGAAEFTNDAIHLVDPTKSIGLAVDLWFSIASVIVLTVLIALRD